MNEKEIFREKYKSIRDGIPSAEKKWASKKIASQLAQVLNFIGVKAVAVYISKGSEPDTRALIRGLLRKKVRIAAPKVVQGKIKYFYVRNLEDCAPGAFGVLEPNAKYAADAKKLDAILVPGIVFDRNGYRLGYGKGFYDKLLSKLKIFNTIGLAYDKTLADVLPRDERDVPVHWIITETQTLCLAHDKK